MLTDEQLTEIWRRRQAVAPGEWDFHRDYHIKVTDSENNFIADCGSPIIKNTYANAIFIANAPADIEALLIEVKRLRGLVYGTPTDAILHALADEIAREYKTPQYDRESTEPPPVIEDQLDSGESE